MSSKEYEPCLDCDGSGEDGAGGPCPICDGTGQAEAALAELEGRELNKQTGETGL